MAIKKFKFETTPRTVVTPLAETLFFVVAEPSEVTGNYGGSLIFTPEQMEQEISYKLWRTNKKIKAKFKDVINDLIDKALEEYRASGKKAVRADKIRPATDKDGNETGNFELTCKNKDKPKVVGKDKAIIKDFDTLLGNGSQIKAQLNLVPYVMQGKVGVTAYVDYVLVDEDKIVAYGGDAGGTMFDDDDFDTGACQFDDSDDEVEGEDDDTDY